MRRIAFATLVAVSVLLLGALPAAAAVTATIQSPASGQEITSPTDAQVRIQRDPLFDPEVGAVALRLVRDGTLTSAAGLACVQGCRSGDQTWGQLVIDPRSPDAFGIDRPLANGTWTVQTRWQSDGTWSTWGGDVDVILSVPPSSVTGLSVDGDALDVTLTWTRAPEPDVSAYRIQRRPEDGAWRNVTSPDASASSYEDTTPSAGTYEYRVITLRPDGDGDVLTATSSSVSVTTTSSGSNSSDDGADPTSDGGSSDGTSDDGGTSGNSDGGETSDDSSSTATAAGTDEDGGDGGSTSTRSRGGARVAPPPGARQRSSLGADADLPQPEGAPRQEERFYGEGEGFSGELDYGDAQAIGPDGTEDGGSALQKFIVSRVETGTLLRSIAAGLLFVALGLHAFRWLHATPND